MRQTHPFRAIVARSVEHSEEEPKEQTYNAELNLYVSMAHYVAKTLYLDPNIILDQWSVPGLIVAFGEYANEATHQAYEQWKSNPHRKLADKPKEYIVQFIGLDELEE